MILFVLRMIYLSEGQDSFLTVRGVFFSKSRKWNKISVLVQTLCITPQSFTGWKKILIPLTSSSSGLILTALSTFICTAKLSYGYSLIRPFNWTTVLVQVHKRWGRTDLLSNSATLEGDMPHKAGCYWTFFPLAKQATNKLASKWFPAD